MALLLVVTTLAILTSLVVEFAWDTHVDLRLAASARDELRAHYLARSATNFSRLLLHFQNQLDQQGKQLTQAMGQLGGGAGALGGLAGGMGGLGSIRLWELIPLESEAITAFVQAVEGGSDRGDVPLPPLSPSPGELVPATGLRSFGTFQGGFSVDIQDEETKLNLNKLDNPGASGMFAGVQLLQLISDPRWDFLFNEDNLHRERVTREEFAIRLKDWIDQDEVESAIDRAATLNLFVPGFADEERSYSRYQPRYRPKNGLFISMDEVHLVAGMSDRLMAAFEDRVTVFPDINSKLNINTQDTFQMLMILQTMAVDPNDAALQNPMVLEAIFEQIAVAKSMGSFMGLQLTHLVQILEGNGILVNPQVKNNPAQSEFGDTSETFTIRATGQVGDVTKTLTTVVRYDASLGKVLYFRED